MALDKQIRFESLLRPHLKTLYTMAYQLTQSRADTEDLTQDLLIKLYPRLDEIATVDNLRPWLARVLYNLFLDLKRRESRSPLHLVVDNEESNTEPSIPLEHEPDALLARNNEQQRLLTALAKLSEEHRIVLTLHDIEGYTLTELADILECPVGTLKSRLHRARARMRELLSKGPC